MDQLEEPLHAIFARHVDTVYRALDAMYADIHRAADLLCESLLAGQRVLVCGTGQGMALGEAFCANLLGRARIDRPGLPAVSIGSAAASGAIAESHGVSEVHARQIRALGQSGDVLLLVAASASGTWLAPAVRAAHDREMRVIALTAGDGGEPTVTLDTGDVELRVPDDDRDRISECQLLLLNALGALVELKLFGEE